jgi:hypothetical protein
MLLHGMRDTEFDIHHGDSLENDWDILREPNPAKKVEFDAVIANPPFSYRWSPTEEMEKDFRFKDFGVAPKSAADFAFLPTWTAPPEIEFMINTIARARRVFALQGRPLAWGGAVRWSGSSVPACVAAGQCLRPGRRGRPCLRRGCG